MKKLGLIVKEASENRIKKYLKESATFFVVKYSGLSSPDLSNLRLSLKSSQADLFVVKNSVARRALKGNGLEEIVKRIEGPCGLVFTLVEPVDASKTLYNFSKDHQQLKLEGGFLKDKILEKKDIEAMAKIPSQLALRTELVMVIKSPITRLVTTLSGTINQLVYCLEQIKSKKTT